MFLGLNRSRMVCVVLGIATGVLTAVRVEGQQAAGNEPNRGGTVDLESQDPAVAIKRLTTAHGYSVSLFASEKEFPLENPVAMAFDAKGRLWIATMPSYPHYLPGEPPNDKLIILEDVDGDGRADRHTVFADKLYLPTGFEIGDGGAYIAAQPNLIFAQDLDGDDVADVRRTILHGFGTEDSHHSISAFTWGPGGALYFQEGIFHNTQVETPWGPVRLRNAGVFRYRPKAHFLEVFVSYPFSNPWGHVFDYWGQNFIADASGGRNYYGLPITGHVDHPRKHPRIQHFTSVVRPTAGCEFVSSRHFPESSQGNFLVTNCIGFQGIKQHRVIEDGSGFTSEEVESLIYSSDRNFRPVNPRFGPDGALWFLDWFNPLIGHMQYSLRDKGRDHRHGRVWRITYDKKPLLKRPPIAGEPIPKLLDLLKSYEDRTRYAVRRELRNHSPQRLAAALEVWVRGLDRSSQGYEHHMLEALWVYQSAGVVKTDLLAKLLRGHDYHTRAAATRVLRYWRDAVEDPLALLETQVNDENPRVRLEAVVALSHFRTPVAAELALETLNHRTDYYLDYGLKETIATLAPYWKPVVTSGQPFPRNNPVGLRYILESLGTADLVKVARSEPVYLALLSRHDASPDDRADAIRGIAALRSTSPLEETVAALERVDLSESEHAGHLVHHFGQMLMADGAVALANVKDGRERVEALSQRGRLGITRQIAYAALVVTDQSSEKVWDDAVSSVTSLRDVVDAVQFVPIALRGAFYPRLSEISAGRSVNLSTDDGPMVRRAAMNAMTHIPGHDGETFDTLAPFVGDPTYRDAAIGALRRIPAEAWPRAQAQPLIDAVLAHIGDVPSEQLTKPTIQDALAFGKDLAALLPVAEAEKARLALDEFGVNVVLIRPVPHKMIYDRKVFYVEAGKPVELVFENADIMPHNLLITEPGALMEVAQAAEQMATRPDAFQKNFIPSSSKVLHSTKMLPPRQSETLSFIAPESTGDYPYVCTFPGHWRTMNGVMKVVDNLTAYREQQLAALKQTQDVKSRPFVRNWNLADLLSEMTELENGRSFERGKEMFKAAACSQCHRVRGEGGIIGPDLTEVTKRLKRHEILREILEPSKVIAEKFGSHVIVTVEGKLVTGIILSQDDKVMRVADNPLQQFEPTEIPLDQVASKEPSKVSLMPTGLLVTLKLEEILDLLAFVESGGNPEGGAFRAGD